MADANVAEIKIEDNEQIRSAFSRWDLNGDGCISREEVGSVLAQCLGNEPEQKDIDAMINSMDLNGNGQIEFEEFYKAYIHKYKHRHQERPSDVPTDMEEQLRGKRRH
eukprot:TRINITY_DN419_c0_g1_i1.p4 TRINITY_DN419_c0_g1~~TRINITY_DN419_c0_g1_i1.p4  ORF type:complete len:108 (-),score=31.35 TRINITY_DN419_c0_g1_i1:289-612(-)